VDSDHPDEATRHQVLDGPPSKGAIDPQALGEDGGGDLLVLGHLREQLVVGGLVEQHSVVHLLLLLTLAPLLLLLLATAGLGGLRRRRRGLVLLRGHLGRGGGAWTATAAQGNGAKGRSLRRRRWLGF